MIFKKEVFRAAQGMCECPGHEHPAETIHHFLKRSLFPQYSEDPDNGMAVAGICHSEIERRLREGGDWVELMPLSRLNKMREKAMTETGRVVL